MPELHSICGWNHCRQHIADNAPGGMFRHYSRKHGGKLPPDDGYEEDWDEEQPMDDFQNHLFWEGAGQRRRAEVDSDDEVGPKEKEEVEAGPRKFRVERHPDAGWACDEHGNWHPERDPPPRTDGLLVDPDSPYAPFDDARQWGWAEQVTTFRMSRRQLDTHMKLHGEMEASPPAFTNFGQYRNIVDDIQYGADWAQWKQVHFKTRPEGLPADASDKYPFLDTEQVFYFRNTDAVLRDLVRNPAFVGRQTYSPERHILPDGFCVTEPHTADRAHEFQKTLNEGTMPIRINIGSDSTCCSLGTGNVSMHPIYMSTSLNDASLLREDRGAVVLVGFFPLLKCRATSAPFKDMFARYARMVRHYCMTVLMEALRPIFTSDQLRQCADGHHRWSRAYMGCQPVDYPEGLGLLSVLKGWVVCCEQIPSKLGDGAGVPRTSESSKEYRAQGRRFARSKGLHMELPFYDSFGIDGHMLIISDLLHQLTKGCFKDFTLDNLFKPYLLDAVGGGGARYDAVMKEIERRLEVLPPCSKLRRFKDGINFKQWTGRHTKALMVIMSAPLWDLSWGPEGTLEHHSLEDEVAQSLSLATIIYMYAASLESTATDREMHAASIELYNLVIRETYQDEREKKKFNWARLHSIFHYVEWTAAHGCAAHSDTSNYENAHIAAVKYPYRASNRCNATVQILRANTRKDQMRALKNVLELSGTIKTARPQADPFYQSGRTILPERGDRKVRMRLPALAEARGLPSLVPLTNAYLADLFGIPDFEFDGKVENHTVASASFPIYASPAYLSNDTCKLQTQRIYSTEAYPYRGEGERVRGQRFDTVLVKSKSYDQLNGLSFDAYDIARTRMLYAVRFRGRRISLCLGEVYEKDPKHSATLPIMQPVVHPVDDDWGEPTYRVFAVEDIIRSVLLQPLFGTLGVPRDLKFMDTLDRWRGHYAVAIFADQHIFRVLFRPDAKKYLKALRRVPWVHPDD